jgi:PAS domain S-box-containing protein
MAPTRIVQHSVLGLEADPELLLGAVVDLSDDAIVMCATNGHITSWGDSAERLFGRSAADVLDGHFHHLFPRHLRPEIDGLISTVVAGERIRHYETEAQRPDGKPLPVSLSLCTVMDADDQVVGTIVVAQDVTEQHLTQATLAEVETRVEEGEALAHVGSWLWDMRTGVVQWSAEFHRIHGVDPAGFDGTLDSFFHFIHEDDQAMMQAAMDASVESGQPFGLHYRVLSPSRQNVVVEIRAQPMFGSDGSTIGLRGIGQEIYSTEPGAS